MYLSLTNPRMTDQEIKREIQNLIREVESDPAREALVKALWAAWHKV